MSSSALMGCPCTVATTSGTTVVICAAPAEPIMPRQMPVRSTDNILPCPWVFDKYANIVSLPQYNYQFCGTLRRLLQGCQRTSVDARRHIWNNAARRNFCDRES